MLLLAEISDKMPTVTETTVVACVIALVALGLGLLRRWLVLVPAPLFIAYDLAQLGELREPGFGQCILNELGWRYVIGCFAGWNLPFLVAIGVVVLRPRRFHRPGHCTHCGYSLHGLPEPRCPECGARACVGGREDTLPE